MTQYVYRVRDNSILTPAFKKFILFPLAARFPRWIPANIITIVSNLCIYATLVVSAALEPFPLLRFITLALLVLIYLTGDHLDGLQAKRTGTSSPLGEFVDHYMDAYNNIVYLLVIFSVFHISNPYIVSFIFFVSYSAHASVFYEQYRTGWLVFEKIGPFEAFGLLILVFLLCCIPGFRLFMQYPLGRDVNMAAAFFLMLSTGTLYTLVKALFRAGKNVYGFYLFLFLLLLVTLAGLSLPFRASINPWIIALYSIHYVGMLIKSHLIDDKYRMPDLIVPSFLLLCMVFPSIAPEYSDIIVFIYLAVRCLISAAHTVYLLHTHWVWVNPVEGTITNKD